MGAILMKFVDGHKPAEPSVTDVAGDLHYEAAFWCVMVGGSMSVAATIDELARHVPDLDRARLHAWAHVLAVYELRPYHSESFTRHAAYLWAGAGPVTPHTP